MADIVGHKWLKNHANEVSTPEQAVAEMMRRKSNIEMRSYAQQQSELANQDSTAAISNNSAPRRNFPLWGNKIYIAADEETRFVSGELENKEVIRLQIKKWPTADAIDRARCQHFFSHLYPSRLLYNLCRMLMEMGIQNTIDETKMKVTITCEKQLCEEEK